MEAGQGAHQVVALAEEEDEAETEGLGGRPQA